ncbi:hypothetical protein [Domibacillus robiginosus]|uniref:hypothetical protein n=1 Tax=Domibacillus robiginosus TaxID=1071054 RepID=UPI00067D323A|nr:hypothetical protein [Domibacillus robiginosus]
MSKLNEAIQSNNIRGIKSAIVAYLSADPLDKSGKVKEAMATVDAKGIQLWQAHDGTELLSDRSKWTKEYFAELQSHLLTNLSKECLEHALKVGRHAYREELNSSQSAQQPSIKQQQGGKSDMGKFLLAGATVLAVGVVIYLAVK